MINTIKYILIWLFIFIIGSLIVNFLISPNSFQSFKENIKSIIPEKEEIKINLSKNENIKTKFEIIELNTTYWDRCSLIKLSAQERDMSEKELNKILCESKCGNIGLDYYSYRCDTDKIYCSCKQY